MGPESEGQRIDIKYILFLTLNFNIDKICFIRRVVNSRKIKRILYGGIALGQNLL